MRLIYTHAAKYGILFLSEHPGQYLARWSESSNQFYVILGLHLYKEVKR